MKGSYLGPFFSEVEISSQLAEVGAEFSLEETQKVTEIVAEELASGKAVGWFQGRMEFGPRALGGRSILGDPRSPKMQKQLNLKVKYRESFRPFAPSIIYEELEDWFELTGPSPYMLLVDQVKKKAMFPDDGSREQFIRYR